MKHYLLTLCISIIALHAFAYNPTVVEGNKWNVVNRNADKQPGELLFTTQVQKIAGDSVVDGVTYKKLLYSTDKEAAEWAFAALLREENEKVWAMVDRKEYLLYDFAAKQNDELLLHTSIAAIKDAVPATKYVVTKIDSVKNLANETIARYTLSDEQNRQTAVYERYGSFTGWMRSNHDGITGGGVDYLRCVYGSASEPVFRLPLPWSDIEIADDECSVWSSVPTSVDNLTHTAGCLFYNAATQTIQTQSAEAATVKVYGIDGQAIMQTQTLTGTIPFAAPAGIYIVVVQTPDNSYTEKIVIR